MPFLLTFFLQQKKVTKNAAATRILLLFSSAKKVTKNAAAT
jgi:hypothetical protein